MAAEAGWKGQVYHPPPPPVFMHGVSLVVKQCCCFAMWLKCLDVTQYCSINCIRSVLLFVHLVPQVWYRGCSQFTCVLGTETNPFPNAICNAGWKAILLTWAWALADFAKFVTSWLLQRAEDIQTECKHVEQPEPAWVKAVNLPGVAGNRLIRVAYKPIAVCSKIAQSWCDFAACLLSSNSRQTFSCEGAQCKIHA